MVLERLNGTGVMTKSSWIELVYLELICDFVRQPNRAIKKYVHIYCDS